MALVMPALACVENSLDSTTLFINMRRDCNVPIAIPIFRLANETITCINRKYELVFFYRLLKVTDHTCTRRRTQSAACFIGSTGCKICIHWLTILRR